MTHKARATQTMGILDKGLYEVDDQMLSLDFDQRTAVESSMLYTPERLEALLAAPDPTAPEFQTVFRVQNAPTVSVIHELASYTTVPSFVLNFASARNPGGGFLNGAQAQEESLARASGLYPCQTACPTYYAANRLDTTLLYTDYAIFSPGVPVFRNGADALVNPYALADIYTAPAPNIGAMSADSPHRLAVPETFRRRIAYSLAVARTHRKTHLILGAWGCGVFRNNPQHVAQYFAEALLPGGRFHNAFVEVRFAVWDRKGETIAPFEKLFGATG